MIWYQALLFTALPGTTVKQSKLILWIAVLVLVAFGCVITTKRHRNGLSLFTNIFLPYELYMIVTYYKHLPILVWGSVLLGCIAVLTFIVLGIIMSPKGERRGSARRKRQLVHSLLGVRIIAAVCMLILLVPITVSNLLGLGLMNSKAPTVSGAAEATEWTVKNNFDTVRLLQEEEWGELDAQQKLDVLGVVMNIEIRYLGINHELDLQCRVLNGKIAAHYTDKDHAIVIDLSHLKNAPASTVLASLCHECYHAYQHQIIELYENTPEEYRSMPLFQNAVTYIEEFSDYEDGSKDYSKYYYQVVEMQARKYARLAVEEYYSTIRQCLAAEG